MEKFVEDYPNLINIPKDDGFTALHLAAINDNLDVVTLLAASVSIPVFIVCVYTEWEFYFISLLCCGMAGGLSGTCLSANCVIKYLGL